jgi:hypothetical protein
MMESVNRRISDKKGSRVPDYTQRIDGFADILRKWVIAPAFSYSRFKG